MDLNSLYTVIDDAYLTAASIFTKRLISCPTRKLKRLLRRTRRQTHPGPMTALRRPRRYRADPNNVIADPNSQSRSRAFDEQPGTYSGPEVGLWEAIPTDIPFSTL